LKHTDSEGEVGHLDDNSVKARVADDENDHCDDDDDGVCLCSF
jgi:hypothetical protein